MTEQPYDIFIIGGGVNGCGIARDAAGRGYRVGLAEMHDLGSATSSSSTKLFHGGLRYLEFFEWRLVREALKEREVLLRAMPHICWPLRFVLPIHDELRFDASTPASKVINFVMPWLRGRRPAWVIRAGLWIYDHLGKREMLSATEQIELRQNPLGLPLKPHLKTAFEYADCWIDDARLVVLNARDAEQHGADILTRHKVTNARAKDGLWHITLRNQQTGIEKHYQAKFLINAAGPWVKNILEDTLQAPNHAKTRLVRGSHIVVHRLYEHDKCYFLQGSDGRIIFTIPYEEKYTMIGTTDNDHADPNSAPICSPDEIAYLCQFVGQYFQKPLHPHEIVWSFSGVRPLYDDGMASASSATRDYVLKMSHHEGAGLLNIFGGKLTTYRKLAEAAMTKIASASPEHRGKSWTAEAALPGGDFAVTGIDNLIEKLHANCPFLSLTTCKRLVRQYGTLVFTIFPQDCTEADCGKYFAEGVYGRELDWSIASEYTETGEDFLWRRTKLGLHVTDKEAAAICAYITQQKALRS